MKRVFAHIGFSFAITLVILNFFQIKTALVISAVTGAAFAVSLLIKRTRRGVAVPLAMLSAVLACVIFISNYYSSFLPQTRLDNVTANAEFYIVDLEEKTTAGSYTYTVKTKSVRAANAPQNIKVKLKSPVQIDADYYEILKGEIRFRLISDNGFRSYGSFGKGIYLSAYTDNAAVTGEEVFSLNSYMLHLRENIIHLIQQNVSSESAGLLIALTTGNKSYLSAETVDNFKASGVMHIMAVSGLHLAVFSGSVYWILKKLRVPKLPHILVSVLSVFFYASLAGFSKSIMRAGIMMVILMAGRLFKEKSDALNSLGLAVFIICLNPYAVTDAGALLTVTAVLGLLVIHPHIRRIFTPKNAVVKYFYNILAASVSVFISTLPVMYFVFGYITPYGILLNLIMIPLAQLTLISSFLMLFSFGASALSFVCGALASFMIDITAFCARLPFAVVGINDVAFGLAIGLVFILFGTAFAINKKHIFRTCTAISAAVFVILLSVSAVLNYNAIYIKEIAGYHSTAVIVYNRKNAAVFGVEDTRQLTAVSNILKSNHLKLYLIVDCDKGNVSERLAEEFRPVNYVSKEKNMNEAVNCNHIYTQNEINVDLWQDFHVEYKYINNRCRMTLTAYNTEFVYTDSKEKHSAESAIYIGAEEYNSVYMVNKDGYTQRRLNEWQK